MSISNTVCEINQATGELYIDGNKIVLRPKTFELLLLLASNPKKVIAKADILSSVWADSVVEDQVVFQSINEIRKEVGIAEAIKTYPRRGYSWEIENTSFIPEASSIVQMQADIVSTNALEKPTNNVHSKAVIAARFKPLNIFWLVSIVLIAISAFWMVMMNSTSEHQSQQSQHSNTMEVAQHYGLLVLPFNVDKLDSSQKWLKYGAMEGLIKQLTPNQDVTVFHLEDVIDILNRLPADERLSSKRIFEKSGASYILQASLLGVPGEYKIIYSLFDRSSHKKGILTAKDIDSVLTLLAKRFNGYVESTDSLAKLGERAEGSGQAQADSKLQNELLIKAIQFIAKEDFNPALAFIESAVINDSNDLMANYFLAKVNARLNKFEQTIELVNQSQKFKQHPDYLLYQPRLSYLKGSALLALGKLEDGQARLTEAAMLAKNAKDWLYYSYTKSMLGKAKQFQGDNQAALSLFNEALNYQELLNCPMGIAQSHLDLAELYLANGDKDKAKQSLEFADNIIRDKQLTPAIEILNHTKAIFKRSEITD